MISDFVQEAMPKRREDVAPFLQRVAVWFTVTKAVQVTKRVVIDDIIATRIVGGLVAAKRRIKTRKRRDAKLKELRSQLKRGHNSLRGGGADDGGASLGASLGASPMTRRARELGVADRHANAEDVENDPRWLSGEYDDGQKQIPARRGGCRRGARRGRDGARHGGQQRRVATSRGHGRQGGRAVTASEVLRLQRGELLLCAIPAIAGPERESGVFGFRRSKASIDAPGRLRRGRARHGQQGDSDGRRRDGGFTDDEEAEQLAHVRAAAKRSAEMARSITESLSPEKPRRESPHGSWRGGSRDSRASAYARTPPMRNTDARASHDFDSPRAGRPGRGIVASPSRRRRRVHAIRPPRRRPHSCLDRTAGPGAGTRRRQGTTTTARAASRGSSPR